MSKSIVYLKALNNYIKLKKIIKGETENLFDFKEKIKILTNSLKLF